MVAESVTATMPVPIAMSGMRWRAVGQRDRRRADVPGVVVEG